MLTSKVLIGGSSWFYVYGNPEHVRTLASQLNLQLDVIQPATVQTIFKIWNISELADIYAEPKVYRTFDGEIIDDGHS